jgi:hypothetical protein
MMHPAPRRNSVAGQSCMATNQILTLLTCIQASLWVQARTLAIFDAHVKVDTAGWSSPALTGSHHHGHFC